mmetsp:Transcript_67237/g.161135  ORF Transcript_67237/g.161135 Transcript_67237/m.161135 type:complete len:249 (-) Transcript_67237:1775-2521(-)
MSFLPQADCLPSFSQGCRSLLHLGGDTGHRPGLGRCHHSKDGQHISGKALIHVATLLVHCLEQVYWQHVLVLQAIEVGRVRRGVDILREASHVLVPVQPPAKPLLHHPEEGLQRVGDPKLASLRHHQMQINWHLAQRRHLMKDGHLDNVLRQADTPRNEEVLSCRAKCLQGHKLAAALPGGEWLAIVRQGDLRLKCLKDLQNVGNSLQESLLIARLEEVEEELRCFGGYILSTNLLVVFPTGSPVLHR